MAPTPTTTSLKRSRSSTPSLGTRPSTPDTAPGKVSSAQPDLATGEPRIKQELDHWEKIVFSFDMDDNRGREGDPNFPDDGSAHPHQYMHQLHRGRGLVAAQHDAPLLPPPSAWDIPPFFPTSTYDQQPPYDVLALGAIGPMPELSPPHAHPSPNPHALLDFGHSSWDMNFYPDIQAPQPQLQPLSPAEIAQYHALMARGAGGFPPPLAPNSGPSSTAASSSIAQADSSMRGRSGSSAGRSSSQSQPPSAPTSPIDDEGNVNITEDKRRRNTAASARFRVKKKQRTADLERTLTELEGRAGELEKEAVELRRENGWLKEMVILKGKKAVETAKASKSSTSGAQQDKPESESQGSEGDEGDRGKGKSKE